MISSAPRRSSTGISLQRRRIAARSSSTAARRAAPPIRRRRSSSARRVATVSVSPVRCASARASRSVSGSLMLRAIGFLGSFLSIFYLRRCPKTIASFRETSARCCSSILDGMSLGHVEGRHFRVRDLDALWIGVAIEFAADFETGFRRGVGDQFDDDEEAEEWRRAPVLRDVAEHAMLDLVPLRSPWRIVANLNDQTGFVRELLEGQLPEPQP